MIKSNEKIERFEKVIHYLKIIQEHYTYFQPEMRKAIDDAITQLKGDKVMMEQLIKSGFIKPDKGEKDE